MKKRTPKIDQDQPIKMPGYILHDAGIEADRLGIKRGKSRVTRHWTKRGKEIDPHPEALLA